MGPESPQPVMLNFAACVLLSVANGVYLVIQRKRLRDDLAYLFRAAIFWGVGIVAWAILWCCLMADVGGETVRLLLSDLNTACCFLFYVCLTRGSRPRFVDHLRDGLPMLVLPGLATGAILAYQKFGHTDIHTGLSLAYSMAAPILVGWALRLRYGGYIPFALSYVYAVLQPPAYGVLFNDGATEFLGVLVLGILALLKIVWGASVLFALGTPIGDSATLVRDVPSGHEAEAPPRNVQAIVWSLLGACALLVLWVAAQAAGQDALTAFTTLCTGVAAIVGMVVGVLEISVRLKARE